MGGARVETTRRRRNRALLASALAACGLAAGFGGAYLLTGSAGAPDQAVPATPSVEHFGFLPAGAAEAPALVLDTGPGGGPVPAAEPVDGPAAVSAFLAAQVDERPDDAYALLDEASRRRFPTVAAWSTSRPLQVRPSAFELVGSRPAEGEATGAVDVEVLAFHEPSLDFFAGLVPARSRQTWRATPEGGRWRVSAEPLALPLHPSAEGATAVAARWLVASAACAPDQARSDEVLDLLLGPADLAARPCQAPGPWVAGSPVGLDQVADAGPFVAAFGPDAALWARAVPATGPAPGFFVVLAPVGDRWQVIGVAGGRP